MTTLPTKTFDQVVSDQATVIQGASSNALVDFSVGSILRAVIEGAGAIVMWLQGMILQLLTTTRAATSAGSDLDTWMADYGLARLGATSASGTVTFARFTPTAQAIVPLGSIVQTADGTQQYVVIADTAQAAFVASSGGYVLPPSTASVTATVQAITGGTIANAAAGAVNTLGQSISGVDTVVNGSAFTSGADAETDAAFRARFVNYIASLSKATRAAVSYAISSVQSGLGFTITENVNYAGTAQPGYFYVVVDDGSGTPPSPLLTAVTMAIDAVRPLSSTFNVYAPTVVTANVAASIATAAGYTHATVVAQVVAAITTYINGLPLGVALSWSRLYQIAYDTSPGVTAVAGLTLNGGTSDVSATAKQAIVAGTVAIT